MDALLLSQALPFDVTEVAIRIVHTGSAAMAAGAVAFQYFALHPTLRTLEEQQRVELRERLIGRWRGFVFTLIGLLLVTGLLTFVLYKLPALREKPVAGLYHGLFGLKFIAALAVFHAVTVLALPGNKGMAYRNRASFWLAWLVGLFVVVFVLGAVLKGISTQA